jgi:hypothetical protein
VSERRPAKRTTSPGVEGREWQTNPNPAGTNTNPTHNSITPSNDQNNNNNSAQSAKPFRVEGSIEVSVVLNCEDNLAASSSMTEGGIGSVTMNSEENSQVSSVSVERASSSINPEKKLKHRSGNLLIHAKTREMGMKFSILFLLFLLLLLLLFLFLFLFFFIFAFGFGYCNLLSLCLSLTPRRNKFCFAIRQRIQ